MPAGDGGGTAVDVSSMGKEKTIVVGGSFVGATVSIQVSVDGGTVFQDIATFSSSGKRTIDVAAQWARVFVRGRSAEPFSANADIGGNNLGSSFLNFVLPAGDGAGPALDISTLGHFTSIVAGGSFRDAVLTVEVSEDGTSYAPCGSFFDPGGVFHKNLVANFARIVVSGRAGNTFPFTPSVSIGAANDPGAGSIGASTEKLITSLSLGESTTHSTATPLVVGQIELNPLDYTLNNTTRSLALHITASVGGGGSGRVELYNVTDSDSIHIETISSATPVNVSVPLTEGSGAGQIDLSSKIYEIRIWVNAPDLVDDVVVLGSASLKIINTVN